MKNIHIKEWLKERDVRVEDIDMDWFDKLGAFTALKRRKPSSKHYTKARVFKPNYERGVLAYYLVRDLKAKNVLEFGTGRGYTVGSVLKAFKDFGINGSMLTIDRIKVKKSYAIEIYNERGSVIRKMGLPQILEWMQLPANMVRYKTGDSNKIEVDGIYDLVFIDGGHDYKTVKNDWKKAVQCIHNNSVIVFDDYDPKSDIQNLIDNGIDRAKWSKELFIMDRCIWPDDRGIKIEDKDYGQVIVRKRK